MMVRLAPADVSASEPLALAELQALMLEAICAPQPPSVRGIVADGPQLAAAARLEIYRRAYTSRLREVLRDDYPVLAATLGESRFADLCQQYIARHPSGSPNLNAWGRRMPEVCAATMPEGGGFFAELASLEWALVEVTHAATAAPLELGALQRMAAESWSEARLVPSAALRVLNFRHPVNAYYQACRTGTTPPALPAPAPSATAIYRRDVTLWRMDLTPAISVVLNALMAGETIAQALTRMEPARQSCPAGAAERSVTIWFREWVAAGFFAGVSIGGAR
jgi:hypothetical protein